MNDLLAHRWKNIYVYIYILTNIDNTTTYSVPKRRTHLTEQLYVQREANRAVQRVSRLGAPLAWATLFSRQLFLARFDVGSHDAPVSPSDVKAFSVEVSVLSFQRQANDKLGRSDP